MAGGQGWDVMRSGEGEVVIMKPEVKKEQVDQVAAGEDRAKEVRREEAADKSENKNQKEDELIKALEAINPSPKSNVIIDPSVQRQIQEAKALVKDPSISPEVAKTTNDFLKTILDAFKGFLRKFGLLSDDGRVDKEKLNNLVDKFIDSRKNKETLTEKGATFQEGKDDGLEVIFPKDAGIGGKKTLKEGNFPTTPTPAAQPIEIRDKKIVLGKGSEITEVKDDKGTLTMKVQNKDGSTDTYTITGAEKKAETPATPATTTPEAPAVSTTPADTK